MIPTPSIEVFVDITSINSPFFELDSDTLGLLDGDAVLAGPQWVDIASRARSYSINRGRATIFGFNNVGQLSVELNNHDRAFDPLWTESTLYGIVTPELPVRIKMNGEIQFVGTIDDWDLSYTPSYDNIARFTATDAFSEWARKTIGEYQPAALNLTSEAIAEALAEIGVTDGGPDTPQGTVMGTAIVAAGTNALQYLQKLATSDFGSFFVKKDGTWDYQPFSRRITGTIATRLADDVDRNIALGSVAYGTENLYNKVTFTFADTGGTVTQSNAASIAAYGTREVTDSATLISGSLFGAYGTVKANEILELYAEPELRIDNVEIYLHDYSEANQAVMLGLELGDRVIITFDPSGTGNTITRICRIIGLSHTVIPDQHIVKMSFESSSSTPLVLDDPQLGRLDAGNFLEKTWDFTAGGGGGGGGFGI